MLDIQAHDCGTGQDNVEWCLVDIISDVLVLCLRSTLYPVSNSGDGQDSISESFKFWVISQVCCGTVDGMPGCMVNESQVRIGQLKYYVNNYISWNKAFGIILLIEL